MRKVAIIGGGLAGLISSIQLTRAGIPCVVIEKKSYPLHRVCGEYVSNEAAPFLHASGLYPDGVFLPRISFLELSSMDGRSCKIDLGLGGFGISRFCFDNFLYRRARTEGVSFQLNTEITAVDFDGAGFQLEGSGGTLVADVVIGSFGKRSRLDMQQNRKFVGKRSPFVGVKYHMRSAQPENLISLHNFTGGYCGVCNVEGGITNVCYLTHRDNLRKFGTIEEMERNVLFSNPHLRDLFGDSAFIFKRPEVINEISFETKGPVENHILMAGDAAGMIAPLCGNGMAIAIRSAKILAEQVVSFCNDRIDRQSMEDQYRIRWNELFRSRLWFGKNVQRLFGHPQTSAFLVRLADVSPSIARLIVSNTHGRPF